VWVELEDELGLDEVEVLPGLTVDVDVDVGLAEVIPTLEEGGGAPPPGQTEGTATGCPAVFQVALEGQAVVATVGEVVPYG